MSDYFEKTVACRRSNIIRLEVFNVGREAWDMRRARDGFFTHRASIRPNDVD